MASTNKYLVAVDFSEASIEAANRLKKFGKAGDKVFLLTVVKHIPFDSSDSNKETKAQRQHTQEKQEPVRQSLIQAGFEVELLVRDGDAREVIVDIAREIYADCIVMSTRGLKGVKRVMIGSCADYVVRHANCPVMVIRPESDSKGE